MIGIFRVVAFGHFFFTPNYDFTNTWGPSYSAIEASLSIIAACIPFMRRVLRQWFPKMFHSSKPNGNVAGGPCEQHHNTPESRSDPSGAIQLYTMESNRAEAEASSRYNDSQEEIMAPPKVARVTLVRCTIWYTIQQPGGKN